MSRRYRWAMLIPVCVLSACTTYHAKPLPTGADLASAPTLSVPITALRVPGLEPHRFDPADGLDSTEVVMLAVMNNPQLKAARLQAGVAGAQLIQAGILPNPQLSESFLAPIGGPPPLSNGYQFGLMQDLTALIARGAARTSAKHHVRQVNLDIVWKEWQVAQQARQLVIQARSQQELQRILRTRRDLSRRAYKRDEKALNQGNVTLGATSADLVTLVDAQTQLRQLERARNQTWHALDALMGLRPGIQPRLVALPSVDRFTDAEFKAAVADLPKRRPDLLALKAGYQSQQANVRRAILEQFPTLSIGPQGGTDTGNVAAIGFGANLSLPLFNQNQGQIAVARATRAVLRQTYQARLDQAVNQAHKTWREIRIMQRQYQQLEGRLPALEQTTDAAQRAFAHGNMSAGTFINLRSSLLSKQVEAIRLKASLEQTQAALETLLGMTIDTRQPASNKGPS